MSKRKFDTGQSPFGGKSTGSGDTLGLTTKIEQPTQEVPLPIEYDTLTESTTAGSITFSSVGIRYIDEDHLTEEEWFATFQLAQQVRQAAWWIIADLAAFAADRWGKKYEWIAERFGYQEKTLRNMAYIASSVNLSLRKDKLTVAHHAHVAPFDSKKQQAYLELAIAKHWNERELKHYIETGKELPADTAGSKLALLLHKSNKRFFTFTKRMKKATLSEAERRELASMIDNQIQQLQELRDIIS